MHVQAESHNRPNLLEHYGVNLDDVIADILRDSEVAKEITYMAKAMAEYRKTG